MMMMSTLLLLMMIDDVNIFGVDDDANIVDGDG